MKSFLSHCQVDVEEAEIDLAVSVVEMQNCGSSSI